MAAAKPVVTGDIDFELFKTMMKQIDSDIDDIIKENEEIEELKLIAFKYAAAYARDPNEIRRRKRRFRNLCQSCV
ncbi:hypothetical protein L3Y34_011208 [Caenorhabditis briggsae]|uniref:Uncharacterized protein n=1 Tax=Caenorhabditis briggsae TaxID=6238 RepID=A0AAE9CU58_CAEBR|nr:hypothetical protein L3Y34_011208 [Caenorhabditis briggsae]